MRKLLALMFAPLFAGTLFAADPFAGTWSLNVATSRLAGPYANLKSETLVIQEQGDQLFIAANVTLPDGSSNSMNEAVARLGGSLAQTAASLPLGVTRSATRINDRTIVLATMRGAQEIQSARNVVSRNRSNCGLSEKALALTANRLNRLRCWTESSLLLFLFGPCIFGTRLDQSAFL
jgi:hypothetical protein